MSTSNRGTRYDEDIKHTLVNLYQSNDKTQAALCKEYGIASITLNRWVKQYSPIETDDGKVLTAKQVKELQTRNTRLKDDTLILKKAYEKRNFPEGLMFHSDRESKYTASIF